MRFTAYGAAREYLLRGIEMLGEDGYELSRVDCGLPSMTSACWGPTTGGKAAHSGCPITW